jgi:hypothetical protein
LTYLRLALIMHATIPLGMGTAGVPGRISAEVSQAPSKPSRGPPAESTFLGERQICTDIIPHGMGSGTNGET